MVGCGRNNEGDPTVVVFIAVVNAGVASDRHLSSPLRVATIGIVSDRVNDVASKCLPAVALMIAAAAVDVVAGGCGRPKLFV